MSQQQRIFETNLKNITDEYVYFMQGVGSDVSSGNSRIICLMMKVFF